MSLNQDQLMKLKLFAALPKPPKRTIENRECACCTTPSFRLIWISLDRSPCPSDRMLCLSSASAFLDDLPVVVQRDWFAEAIAPGILEIDWTSGNRSLYAEFNNRYGVMPSTRSVNLERAVGSELEANLLQLDLPAAVLTLDQISYDNEYRPVNVSAMAYHPVRYPLSLTQFRRRGLRVETLDYRHALAQKVRADCRRSALRQLWTCCAGCEQPFE